MAVQSVESPGAEQAPDERSTRVEGFLRWFGLAGLSPQRYVLTRWLFLRGFGLIYLVAFASWWMQVYGLIGSRGVAPIAPTLDTLPQRMGSGGRLDLFMQFPTLYWWNSTDSFIGLLCGLGVVLSILVILDILPLPALAGLWLLYLSQVYAGQEFMSYQWDILLLEAGFLAIFLAPLHILPFRLPPYRMPYRNSVRSESVPRAVVWLFRVLLFRLMFESGYVKLASGDPTWADLTATTFHYWTQPLPSPLAWYINLLPPAFHTVEVLFTFAVELVAPFLIFAPRRLRFVGAGLMALLQLLIFLTGNYTFFNLLTMLLCLLLLDDPFLRRILPRRFTRRFAEQDPTKGNGQPSARPLPRVWRVVIAVVAAYIGIQNVVQLGDTFFPGLVPSPVISLAGGFNAFHLVNGYGLFAMMTTTRPEIIIEGSSDGQTWLSYEFKYKAGDLSRSPAWVAPFQPRLDWQMWFVALEGTPERWFQTFIKRLLEGDQTVLALLGKNPFPDQPPRLIRARLYMYHFTTWAERQTSGQWWQREFFAEFMPPISLDQMAS